MLKHLSISYDDPDRRGTAQHNIARLYQPKKTFAEYLTLFMSDFCSDDMKQRTSSRPKQSLTASKRSLVVRTSLVLRHRAIILT